MNGLSFKHPDPERGQLLDEGGHLGGLGQVDPGLGHHLELHPRLALARHAEVILAPGFQVERVELRDRAAAHLVKQGAIFKLG